MNKDKIKAIYGPNWDLKANTIKAEAGYKCTNKQCTALKKGKNILTVHHIDGCPRHSERSNLQALCQICHLKTQKFIAPCTLLMQWKPKMSKENIDALCSKCPKNRQAIANKTAFTPVIQV